MNVPDKTILGFIACFKGSERTFLHGCCYWFAHILWERFDAEYSVDIKYEPVQGHFITKINNRFYDIRGDVTELYRGKPMYDLYELNHNDNKYFQRLMRDCRDFIDPRDSLQAK